MELSFRPPLFIPLMIVTGFSGAIATPGLSFPVSQINPPILNQPILNPPILNSPILNRPILKPLPDSIRPVRTCPDPAANSITFQIIRRDTPFRGHVRITGVVKNKGLAAYESGPNQQLMYLYENGNLVKTQAFQNLGPGATTQIVYERLWNSSSPAEGEFPPTYRLSIGYDPDIAIDGNPKNDDCVPGNNNLERSGTGINDLFG